MAIHPERLLNRVFEPKHHHYTRSDTILYALSCGLGSEPTHGGQLRYVYENAYGGQQVLPTMANILGYAGFWADQPDTGIDWRRLVHAEQKIMLTRPLDVEGKVIGQNRVVGLHDKGEQKGALMLQERRIVDASTGDLLATVTQTTFLRGDGGFGDRYGVSHGVLPDLPHAIPERAADWVSDIKVPEQMALLYRLNGDRNPLHADPDVASAAGFARPILHGLATQGIAMHAALQTVLDYDAADVRGMRVRFTAPVLPGDTLRTEIWRDADVLSLRCSAVERKVTVLNNGRIDLS